jgi:O-antigen ligase
MMAYAVPGGLALLCAAGFAARYPIAATVAWMLALEAMPEFWLTQAAGPHEAMIALLKAAGVGLVVILAFRDGVRFDSFNPAFAFLFMFIAGLAHGLYPGLSVSESLRSLAGSAAPFLFGFVRLRARWCRVVIRAATLGPLWSVAFGFALQLAHLHQMTDTELGGIRLRGPGEAPFLAGFALIAIYAGLREVLAAPNRLDFCLLVANFAILLLTGARAPLALAVAMAALALWLPAPRIGARVKITILACVGAVVSLAVMFSGSLGFLRVVGLAQAGEATNLSNRGLTWPYFQAAFHQSPWFGWGVGAGKVVIPLHAALSAAIGTNAAHNEYLRIGAEGGMCGVALLVLLLGFWAARGSAALPPAERWLMRAVFVALAVHSWTDNTLIATTSSILFIWVAAVFASGAQAAKAAA